MSLGTILLIIVILMLLGAIPTWPHSRGWGYGPSGGLGLVLVIQLSGFVDSQADINKAVELARGVKGVTSVKNDMRVK